MPCALFRVNSKEVNPVTATEQAALIAAGHHNYWGDTMTYSDDPLVPLTEDEVHEAIAQMLTTCDLAMPEYRPLSARLVLSELGYSAHVPQILRHIADGGFDYCLDSTIPASGHNNDYPSQDVCYWGPDQLKSRLQCLRNFPAHLWRR